jgi:hypothetical protein
LSVHLIYKKIKNNVFFLFFSLCGGAAWSDRRHASAQPQDKEIRSNITFLYFNKFIFVHSLFLLFVRYHIGGSPSANLKVKILLKGTCTVVKNEGIALKAVHDALIAIS